MPERALFNNYIDLIIKFIKCNMGDDDRRQPSPLEGFSKGSDEENCPGEPSENENLKKCIEEEVKLITKIFPLLRHEMINEMLTKLGNLPKRSRAVLRQLSFQHEQNKSANHPLNSDFTDKLRFNNKQDKTKNCDSNEIYLIDDDQLTPSPEYLQPQFKKLAFNDKFSVLKRVLPDAEPNYLKMQLVRLANNPEQLNLFVNNALKVRNYPTKASKGQVPWNKILQSQLNNTNFGKRGSARGGFNSLGGFPWPAPLPNIRNRPAPQAKKKKQKNTDDKVNLDELFNRSKGNCNSPYPQTSQAYNLGNFGQTRIGGVQPNFAQFNSNYSKSYPKKAEEILCAQPKEDSALYTTKFSVQTFVKTIPNPENYFRENRHNKPWNGQCENYATCALFNIYNKISLDKIKECIFIAPNFLAACDMLDKVTVFDGKFRPDLPMPPPVDDIPLLKEIAYKMHHAEILQFISTQKEVFRLKIAEAEEAGLSHNCECCYNKEVLPEDVFKCEGNCCFCRNCMRTNVEELFLYDQGMLDCLNNCGAQFSINTLQRALPEQLFKKIMGRKLQENLVYCPFCDFGAVPEMEGTVFNCLNVDCLKESCRMCRAPNHIPDPCTDIEQDENVFARTYIENKMTEAILRKCYECNMKFVKSGGCNTIKCPCGAQMCYICRKPVTDLYLHRGCQKHSVAKIDEEMVMQAAMEARKEVFSILKIDPTIGMKRYFNDLRKINLELKKENEAANFSDNKDVSVFIGQSKRRRGETTSTFQDANAGPSNSLEPFTSRAKRIARL